MTKYLFHFGCKTANTAKVRIQSRTTVVLQCRPATDVLQNTTADSDTTVVPQWYYSGTTAVLQRYYSCTTVVPQWSITIKDDKIILLVLPNLQYVSQKIFSLTFSPEEFALFIGPR